MRITKSEPCKPKRKRLVVLRRGNEALTPGMKNNYGYTLIRSYWFNGERWYYLRDEATGKGYEAPDILFD